MMKNDELMNIFSDNYNDLNKIIKNYKLYNTRNKFIKGSIKLGIGVGRVIPFAASFLVFAKVFSLTNDTPFVRDNVNKYLNVETIDTTDGMHIEHSSYDHSYKNKSLEYNTGWELNDKGLYERTVTYYEIYNKKSLNNKQEILALSKDELDSTYKIYDIETIKKKELGPEDYIYKNDGVIITDNYVSDDVYLIKKETFSKNIWDTSKWFFLSLMAGTVIAGIETNLFNKLLKDKVNKYLESLAFYTDEEIENFKSRNDIRKQNIELLTDSNDQENFSYQLRKKNK